MKLRPFITLLLILTLAALATAFPLQSPPRPPLDRDEEKLTPEEEREARQVAALFLKRWQETEDIGPLMEEFFVPDFADRLRHEPQVLYLAEIRRELLVTENRDELERHYVAMTNFVRLVFRLYEVHEAMGPSSEEQDGPELYEVIPAGVWNLLRSNPTTYALLAEEMGEKIRGQEEAQEEEMAKGEEAKTIKTIEQLHRLTATLEQASLLLRDHLKTLRSTLPAKEGSREEKGDADSHRAETSDPLSPRLTILGSDFYDYPPGTRLIYFHILMFRVDLVRVGQHLKVLSVYMQGD